MSFSKLLDQLNRVIQGERIEIKRNSYRRAAAGALIETDRLRRLQDRDRHRTNGRDCNGDGHHWKASRGREETLQLQMQEIKSKLATYRNRSETLSTHVELAEQQLNEMKLKNNELVLELTKLKPKHDQQEAQRLALEAQVKELRIKLKESDKIRDKIGKAKKVYYRQSQHLINDLNHRIDRLHQKISSKNQEIDNLKLTLSMHQYLESDSPSRFETIDDNQEDTVGDIRQATDRDVKPMSISPEPNKDQDNEVSPKKECYHDAQTQVIPTRRRIKLEFKVEPREVVTTKLEPKLETTSDQ